MHLSDINLLRKAMLIGFIPFVAALVFMMALYYVIEGLESNLQEERQTRETTQLALMAFTSIGQVGALVDVYGQTNDSDSFREYQNSAANARSILARLRNRTITDGRLRSLVQDLFAQAEAALRLAELTVKLQELNGHTVARMQSISLNIEAVQLASDLMRTSKEFQKLLDPSSRSDAASFRFRNLLRSLIVVGLAGAGLTSILVAVAISREIVARLNKLVENSQRLSRFEPLLPPTPGKDEIAILDGSFHEMAQRLLKATELLKASEAEVRLLTSSIAHDITAPLMILQNNLEGLQETARHGQFDEADLEMIEATINQAKRLGRLTEGLLGVGKSGIDATPLKLTNVSLKSLMKECVASLHGTAEAADVDIVLEAQEFSGLVDEDKIARLFINLLTNALKYSPTGSCITVSIKEVGSLIELSVADQGQGIPAGMENQIFQPYIQAETGNTGTGLGLAICAEIVELHGGTIGVTNNPAKGATFLVTLPHLTSS